MTLKFVTLTKGCFNNNYLLISTVIDIFPVDSIGGSNSSSKGKDITLNVGMRQNIITDIDSEHNIIRDRSWFTKFAEIHNLTVGDQVVLEKTGEREFHLYPKR